MVIEDAPNGMRVGGAGRCAIAVCLSALVLFGWTGNPVHAQGAPGTVQIPRAKPDPNAPAQIPADLVNPLDPASPIENLIDPAPTPAPAFSDVLIPYAPASGGDGFSDDGTGQAALYLMAKLTMESQPLEQGMVWRVYSEATNAEGRLELIAKANGGNAEFRLEPGSYMVHAAYGHASATNRIVIGNEVLSKQVNLNAGGIRLLSALQDGPPLPENEVAFDVFRSEFNERGERSLVASNVRPGKILRLNADTYHIVSRYGEANAIIRTDIQVLPGKLTEAEIYHRAAGITLKLVNERGGEAIANTTWSVLNLGGDVVVEATGAFPGFVLAAGEYEAIARNNGQTYVHSFNVEPGVTREVEVITSTSLANTGTSNGG